MVRAEIAQPFKLVALAALSTGKKGLDEAVGKSLERLRIDIRQPVTPFGRIFGVFLCEQMIVQSHLGFERMGRGNPVDGGFDFAPPLRRTTFCFWIVGAA